MLCVRYLFLYKLSVILTVFCMLSFINVDCRMVLNTCAYFFRNLAIIKKERTTDPVNAHQAPGIPKTATEKGYVHLEEKMITLENGSYFICNNFSAEMGKKTKMKYEPVHVHVPLIYHIWVKIKID